MKGIVLTGTDRLEVTDRLEEPGTGPGEVVVRMLAGGVCGSDLSVVHGHRSIPRMPWVIGHEGGGEIVAVGDGVDAERVGQRVVIEPNYACLECAWCRRGETKMCVERRIVGINRPGLFAEHVAVPDRFAWRVPDETPERVLASFEPSVVAHTAVVRTLAEYPDAREALVVGAGSQGLLVTTQLVAAGLHPAVSEPHPGKRASALEHGAHDSADEPEARYDLVFETSGAPAGLRFALERAQKLGAICVIGQTNRPTEIVSETIVQKQLRIHGQLIYNHPVDFADAIASLASGGLDPTIALREPVDPRQGAADILAAADLDGKIWMHFGDWE